MQKKGFYRILRGPWKEGTKEATDSLPGDQQAWMQESDPMGPV